MIESRAARTVPGRPGGAGGSGKSTWAAAHYRTVEIVSSDALRAVVGTGPADLTPAPTRSPCSTGSSGPAGRRLTIVVDTLGLDPDRRRSTGDRPRAPDCLRWRSCSTPPPEECRRRNAHVTVPVPAGVLTSSAPRRSDAVRVIPAARAGIR